MLYEKATANYPRLKTDSFFADYRNSYSYVGCVDTANKFAQRAQLLDENLWKRFVKQFADGNADDDDAGWRGEFWGKMMRGACFVYSYTKDGQLYDILTQTVRDMLACQDAKGRISTYSEACEFDGWDIWGRKYVLLGMQYFVEICTDEALKREITSSMVKQVDYIMSKIGDGEGKMPITKATRNWRGLNSSSLLEPIVRLYSITGEQRFLDFAEYIVGCGGTDVVNIFDLAYENKLMPWQYSVTKAYEMMSCFEGLLEFYRVTGNEKYKTAIVNFADKILETDFTVIGSCGCTHELFDHSKVRQANTTNGKIQQETCVTVTLMKFFYQLMLLTGDAKYADAFETSLYNAYLGSVNTEKVIEPTIIENHSDWNIEPLPFDSYSPLTAGTRGNGVGGLLVMSDNHYYGCCACIGAAGIGLVPKMQLLTSKDGFAFNLYIDGEIVSKTPQNRDIRFVTKTEYPKNGEVEIEIDLPSPERFKLAFRNPLWSEKTDITVNGCAADSEKGYTVIEREWVKGDVVKINLDMSTRAIYPIPYGTDILMNKVIWGSNYMVSTFDKEDPIAKNHIALQRGPVMLAQDSRLGYCVDEPLNIKVNDDGCVDVCVTPVNEYDNILGVNVPLKNGGFIKLTDYASAGKLWTEQSKMAVWMLTEDM